MPYPLYLSHGFQSIFLTAAGRAGTVNGRGYRHLGARFVAPKTRYKSRRPISFYRDVVIGELPRKPPGQCSSGYYVGSAITVSVSRFISSRCRAVTILVWQHAPRDLLSPLPCAGQHSISRCSEDIEMRSCLCFHRDL